MTPGHTLVSVVLRQVMHAAAGRPTPPPAGPIPVLPSLPPGISVPPERTGQIVAAAFAIFLDLCGLAALGIGNLITRYRRSSRAGRRLINVPPGQGCIRDP